MTSPATTPARRTTLRTVVAGVVVVVVVVATGGWLLTRNDSPRTQPVEPVIDEVSNGVIMVRNGEGGAWRTIGGNGSGREFEFYPAEPRPGTPVDFTTDGSELIYQTRDGTLSAVDLQRGLVRAIWSCPGRCDADLSADGQQVAVTTARGLEVLSVEGGRVRTVVAPRSLQISGPQWSPDGRRISFVGPGGLYAVGADGSGLRRLFAVSPPKVAQSPSWSPDGTSIAFIVGFVIERVNDEVLDRRYAVTVIGSDGTNPVGIHHAGHCFCRLEPTPRLAWSPDGELIAVTAAVSGWNANGVYTVRPDGTGWTRLASGMFAEGPAWQPTTPSSP